MLVLEDKVVKIALFEISLIANLAVKLEFFCYVLATQDHHPTQDHHLGNWIN